MLRRPIKNGLAYTYTYRSTKQKPTEQRKEKRREGSLLAKGVNYKQWTPWTQGQPKQEIQS